MARPTAIIDIGSNSIRLVVYGGPARVPAVLFNEKVAAGLGRGLARSGAIDPDAMALGRAALARFAAVVRATGATVRTVATAAVRDASNGAELIAAAARIGLDVELLSGEQEAAAAGMGVLSGIPDADGIVGDLGGGSLELVRVRRGKLGERVSFPLGVLRIAELRQRGKLGRRVAGLLDEAGWNGRGRGLPLYLVGGSWRALAHLDMALRRYPLPVVHQYAMGADTVAGLVRTIPHLSKQRLRAMPGVSAGRAATLTDAATLLGILVRRLGSSGAVASTFGLREGLLFEALDRKSRALDPLIEAAREEAHALGRFAEGGSSAGDLLAQWIAPTFTADPAPEARVRHAACLLADLGWRANPDFRAERGVEVALHGNWVAITPAERAQLAQALHTALGGGTEAPAPLDALADPAALRRAAGWGLAIRLGQRLSAGLAGPLKASSLTRRRDRLVLRLDDPALYGDAVEKRHVALAGLIGLAAAR